MMTGKDPMQQQYGRQIMCLKHISTQLKKFYFDFTLVRVSFYNFVFWSGWTRFVLEVIPFEL